MAVAKGKITPGKAFLIGVGVIAIGGGAYYIGKKMTQNNEDEIPVQDDIDVNINVNPYRQISSGNDNFPLKKGSKGERVRQLQQGLQRLLGEKILASYTGVDGDFGSGTESALKAAGFPTVIDEAAFNRIIGKDSSMLPAFNSRTIANLLYAGANGKNLAGVISALRQIKTVADYSAVNKSFIDLQMFSVSSSIVTYLLDKAFSSDENAKRQIRAEFLRFGLKSSASDPLNQDGKWSLSGLKGFSDIITIGDTYVLSSKGIKIPVRRKTILGEQISIANGMTTFKSIQGELFRVPTAQVRYA